MTLTSPMVPKANIGLILFNENYLNDYFIDLFTHFWRRKWQPTPVFLPGETYGQRATVQKVAKSRIIGKYPDAGKDGMQKEKGVAEDDMVR